MYILIDDMRDLGCDIICRTGPAGLVVLEHMEGKFDVLCIDHDLGPVPALTGLDVIKVACLENLLPNEVQIVSSNPVGVTNIGNVLKDNGFTPDPSNRVFKRK